MTFRLSLLDDDNSINGFQSKPDNFRPVEYTSRTPLAIWVNEDEHLNSCLEFYGA